MTSSNTVTFLVVATMTFLLFTSCLATSDPNLYVNKTQELMENGESRAADGAAAVAGKSLSLSDLVYGTSDAASNRQQSDAVGYLTEEDFQNALAVEDSSDVTNPNWIAGHQHQSSNLFEGDIAGVKSARELRNAIIGVNFRWPDAVIPYVITSSYTPSDRSVIARAMMEYHNKTCIRFVPRTIQPDYIIIKTTGSGCNSNIGRTGGSQVVSLDQGCVHVSLIIHELMHAAGFFHEQSRTDRDDYVVINYGNIQDGMQNNFNKLGPDMIEFLGTSYDTGSVMHYDQFAFAKDRNVPTIYSKTGGTLGNTQGFSQNDVLKLNLMYQCSPVVETTTAMATTPSTTAVTDSTTVVPITTVTTSIQMSTTTTSGASIIPTTESTTQGTTAVTNGPTQMPFTTTTTSQVTTGPSECEDRLAGCDVWLDDGFCENSTDLMSVFCRKTCGFCSTRPEVCLDVISFCPQWANSGLCIASQEFMLANCPKSCDFCKAS